MTASRGVAATHLNRFAHTHDGGSCSTAAVSPKLFSSVTRPAPGSRASASARAGACVTTNDLGVARGTRDQAASGPISRVQAGLGLVQHHQVGRARREQRGGEQEVAQGPVRLFGALDGAQQAGLVEGEGELSAPLGDVEARAREGVVDRPRQPGLVADLDDRPQGRARSDPSPARTGVRVPTCGRRGGASGSVRRWS